MKTLQQMLDYEKTLVHLQGIGKVKGKPAKDFKIGEKMMWNYGYTSEIVGIVKETPTMITFQTLLKGKTYERRLKKTRLVAIG